MSNNTFLELIAKLKTQFTKGAQLITRLLSTVFTGESNIIAVANRLSSLSGAATLKQKFEILVNNITTIIGNAPIFNLGVVANTTTYIIITLGTFLWEAWTNKNWEEQTELNWEEII